MRTAEVWSDGDMTAMKKMKTHQEGLSVAAEEVADDEGWEWRASGLKGKSDGSDEASCDKVS